MCAKCKAAECLLSTASIVFLHMFMQNCGHDSSSCNTQQYTVSATPLPQTTASQILPALYSSLCRELQHYRNCCTACPSCRGCTQDYELRRHYSTSLQHTRCHLQLYITDLMYVLSHCQQLLLYAKACRPAGLEPECVLVRDSTVLGKPCIRQTKQEEDRK